jgi:hypothetical protein
MPDRLGCGILHSVLKLTCSAWMLLRRLITGGSRSLGPLLQQPGRPKTSAARWCL